MLQKCYRERGYTSKVMMSSKNVRETALPCMEMHTVGSLSLFGFKVLKQSGEKPISSHWKAQLRTKRRAVFMSTLSDKALSI